MKDAKTRDELRNAILAAAEAAAELAVIRMQDAGPYETDCAYMAVSRSSDKLDEALAAIFGGENHG